MIYRQWQEREQAKRREILEGDRDPKHWHLGAILVAMLVAVFIPSGVKELARIMPSHPKVERRFPADDANPLDFDNIETQQWGHVVYDSKRQKMVVFGGGHDYVEGQGQQCQYEPKADTISCIDHLNHTSIYDPNTGSWR
jgi:hypothetical protein